MLRMILIMACVLVFHTPARAVDLGQWACGLMAPIAPTEADGSTGRSNVAQQTGLIKVSATAGSGACALPDLRAHMSRLETGLEGRGPSGFALHPDFARNGRAFASHVAPLREEGPDGWNQTRRVSDPKHLPGFDAIGPVPERVRITLDWPGQSHKGDGLALGSDGFPYIGGGGGAHGVGKNLIRSAYELQGSRLCWDRTARDTQSARHVLTNDKVSPYGQTAKLSK